MPRIPDEALARWIPHLVRVWRDGRGGPPPGRGPARGRHQGQRFPPRGEPRSRGGRRDLLAPDELREVGAAVARLSRGLTRERELAGARYLDEERLLGAYLLFYWPVSYLQARGILSELPRRPRHRARPRQRPRAGRVRGARRRRRRGGRRRPVRARARRGAGARGRRRGAHRHARVEPVPRRAARGARRRAAFDLVTMGHVVNELFPGPDADRRRPDCSRRRSSSSPRAARARRHRAGAARDLARAAPRARSPGRARVRRPRALPLPRAVPRARPRDRLVPRRAAHRAAADRRADRQGRRPAQGGGEDELPRARAAGEGWAEPPAGRVFRIVSEPLASKGRLRYMGCGPEGRVGLSLQEKHVSDANRRFGGLLRGDVVEVTGCRAARRWPRARRGLCGEGDRSRRAPRPAWRAAGGGMMLRPPGDPC